MDADKQVLSCDVCGRMVRGAFDDDRLSYCSGCQRFVCRICWVAGRDICRLCLHAGRSVAPRLQPQIAETFVPSTAVQARPVPPSARRSIDGEQVPAPAPRRRPPRKRASRFRRLWPAVVGVAAVGTMAVGAALATSLGLDDPIGVPPTAPVSRGAVLSGGASAAPTVAPTDALVTAETYTVQAGDTLRAIARAVYGDELQWRRIYDANRAVLPDADRLSVGQVLTIPRP